MHPADADGGPVDWETLARIRQWWDGPFGEGDPRPGDACTAADLGADNVTVSNHGGRQLDGAPAALDALPGVVTAVCDRVPGYLDSGIRRGTHVVISLALGARAVAVGGPYLYGLADGDEDGVVAVLEILRAKIARALPLIGVGAVADLRPSDVIAVSAADR